LFTQIPWAKEDFYGSFFFSLETSFIFVDFRKAKANPSVIRDKRTPREPKNPSGSNRSNS